MLSILIFYPIYIYCLIICTIYKTKTRIGVFAQYCVYPRMVYSLAIVMPPAPILDDRKSLSIAFLAISDQYTTFIFFTKWLPAAILDDQKSLSIFSAFQINTQLLFVSQNGCQQPFWMTENHFIAFLAISDQYATCFSQNGCRRPFWMTENHFRMHFSPFQINTQLLFLLLFFKMAASGHFGSPICAKNNRVLPLCVINGYAKYEVDR